MSDPKWPRSSRDQPDTCREVGPSEYSDDHELVEDEAPLTEAQCLEAERRILLYEQDPGRCSTWEEVKRRLESKR